MSQKNRGQKKERRLAPPLRRSLSELRFWWTADPPRPFQLRPVPPCSASRLRSRTDYVRLSLSTLPPKLLRLSRRTAYPSRVTLSGTTFVWQSSVWVTCPVPPGHLPFSVALQRLPAGRPSGSGLLRTGESNYSRAMGLSNAKMCNLGTESQGSPYIKITSC